MVGWLNDLLDLLGLLDLRGLSKRVTLTKFKKFVGENILEEISLENLEVEHDFSGGLSNRVTLKFSWKPSNFIEFRIPYDFAIAS